MYVSIKLKQNKINGLINVSIPSQKKWLTENRNKSLI